MDFTLKKINEKEKEIIKHLDAYHKLVERIQAKYPNIAGLKVDYIVIPTSQDKIVNIYEKYNDKYVLEWLLGGV